MSDDHFLLAAGAAGLGLWLYSRHESKQRHAVATATAPPSAPVDIAAAVVDREVERQLAEARAAISQSRPTATPAAPAIRPASTGSSAPPRRVSGPTQPITREFDPLFAAYGQALPVAYLRALAAHESDMHAGISDGPAVGLLQVVDVVREDFNVRHGTHFTRAQLLVPLVNVQVAADAIRRIVDSYRTNHPHVHNLLEDWRNPRFVELATLGWVAGWSERGGVGRVASYLEHTNRPDVTLAAVSDAALLAGASAHLWNPAKVAYARAVAATYFQERARDEHEHRHADPPVVVIAPTAPTGTAPVAQPDVGPVSSPT